MINTRKIICKFLNSLHWLTSLIESPEIIFEEGTSPQVENVKCGAASAYLHVVYAMQFTLISCFHYLKIALELVELGVNQTSKKTNEDIRIGKYEEYVIPRFDSVYLSDNSVYLNEQERSETFGDYELSSSNVEKILRWYLKHLLHNLSMVTNKRYRRTEKVIDSLRSTSSLFRCACVQEIFLVLYHFINRYYPKQFWVMLSYAMKIHEKPVHSTDEADYPQFYRFVWTFYKHFFPLLALGQNSEKVCTKEKMYGKNVQEHKMNNANEGYQDNYTYATKDFLAHSKEVLQLQLRNTLKLLDEKLSEQTLRSLLLSMIQISNVSRIVARDKKDETSTSDVVALSLLWDFFIKRLNNRFKTTVNSGSEAISQSIDTGLTVLATSHECWASIVRETILSFKDNDSMDHLKDVLTSSCLPATKINSFYLFVRLTAMQLEPLERYDKEFATIITLSKSKTTKSVKQFVGRIRSKLPSSKIQSLEEIGLHHLFTMFIALILSQQGDTFDNYASLAAIAEAVLSLAKEESKSANNVATRRLTTYLRGLATVLVLLLTTLNNRIPNLENQITLEEILKERKRLTDVVRSFLNIISLRVESSIDTSSISSIGLEKLSFSAADNSIKVYADLLQEPKCLSSTTIFLSHPNLIHAGLGRYLQHKQKSNSGITEVRNVLMSLIAVITRLRRFYQQIERNSTMTLSVEQRSAKEGIDETCINIWKHVYPVIKNSLCTYSIGGNVGLSTKVASQVAEFIIAMTLLSQSLAGSSSPPIAQSNPIESFTEMFKYYLQSPVVHPAVASAFLLNIVQNNKHGFELDATQELLLLKGWVRCSTLLLPNDEILGQLSQYILPLCAKLSYCSATYDVKETDGIVTFFKESSKLYIRSSFCQSLRNRYDPFFDSYIDCINRNFQQVINSASQAALHRIYAVGSHIVKNCTRLLYVEKVVNKLQLILHRLLTSSNMLKEDFNMTNDMKFVLSQTLSDFIIGIGTIQQLQNDQFATRTLKTIYVNYLHRFEVNGEHPFIQVFKKFDPNISCDVNTSEDDFPMSCFVNYKEMSTLFFQSIRNEFLTKQPNNKQRLRLKHTLDFVLTLINIAPKMSVFVAQSIFSAIIDIRLTISLDDCGVKNLTAELISALVKMCGSTSDLKKENPALLNIIYKEIEKTIESQMAFYVDETFQLLTAVSTLNTNIVKLLMPTIETTIKRIEKKRGIQSSEGGIFQRRLFELKKRVDV